MTRGHAAEGAPGNGRGERGTRPEVGGDGVVEALPGEEMLRLRDSLRRLFSGLGIRASVNLTTFGLRRAMAVNPLSLDEARTLERALSGGAWLRPGVAVWCRERGLVGEVVTLGECGQRVRLRSLAGRGEFWAEPAGLRPATLVDIDAARDAATRLVPGEERP